MKILLSPAKSLDYNFDNKAFDYSVPAFLPETEKLLLKMKKLSSKKIADLMHVSKDLAELNYNRYQSFVLPEHPSEEIKQAGFVFSGEVYKGLDFRSLNKKEMQFAQENTRILSGLYGLLKPLDLIFPYRLEMGTKLPISASHKNLYSFWEKSLSQSLKDETTENEVIVNLASNEYIKAIQPKLLKRTIISLVFKELKGDDYKIVMMYAKHARGAMARYIIQNKLTEVENIKNYQIDGYRFHEALSNETEWVFTR